MRFFLFLCLLILSLSLPAPTALFAQEHQTSTNQPRIIPLYSAFSEILEALGAADMIVAKTQADTLPALNDRPSVGTHMRPNIERIAALSPDLVLQLPGRGEAAKLTQALRQLGIHVLELPLDSFADIWQVTTRLGDVVGKTKEAQALVSTWQAELRAIEERPKKKRVRVFFEVRSPELLGAGTRNIVHEIIAAAGGENVVTVPKKLVHLTDEALIVLDPDAFIIQKGPMNKNPEDPEKRPGLAILRAVKEKRVLVVEEELFSHPGPRSLKACDLLEHWLHDQSRASQ